MSTGWSKGRLSMRPLFLAVAFALLVGMVFFCWMHRFEYANGSHVVSLSDLREGEAVSADAGVEWLGLGSKPSLRLNLSGAGSKLVYRIRIPDIGRVQFLHVRISLRGDGLVPGKEIWEDGRVMLEWHQEGIDTWKVEALGSVRYNQSEHGDEFVARATKGGAVPVLRLEHLGQGGAFELQELELREVCETVWWRYGRWASAFAWLAWGCAVIRSWQKVPFVRTLAASAAFVTMGIIAVVPGQWKIQRPLGTSFEIKENPQSVSPRVDSSNSGDSRNPAVSSSSNTVLHDPQQPLGKIPVQGGILLKAKHYLPAFRPVLHILLISAPTLAMALLAGWRPALLLAVILSVAIEIAQTAFGYGFDRTDVIDLVCDALGIAAALATYQVVVRKWKAIKAWALKSEDEKLKI